ncbi:MAG TPA: membrane bound O-acyl transferase family-domain-containing protein [Verrucomicrobiae bacterium]
MNRILAALLLLCLTALPFSVKEQLPAWMFMWALAFALYFGCKVLTLVEAGPAFITTHGFRTLGYLLLWPGMDPKPFTQKAKDFITPNMKAWATALFRTLHGAALIWIVVPRINEVHWIPRAIIGMLGVILLLHFGLFRLLALGWQSRHIAVRPLMDNPTRATSLTEFWGRRWNSGFHDLMHRYIFRPSTKRFGVRTAMLLVFLASGLIHELVITVPAGGGYGLPTLYFLLQGLGVEMERSDFGKRLQLGHGAKGWCFVFLVTAGPVALLFPPPFLHNVILPMLKTIT